MTASARPLVVIAGKINPAGVAQLESEARVVIAPDQEPNTVIELSREAEGILFRAGPRCDDAILGACPRLRVIGRHGVGLDTVDLDAATRRGVAVVHAPGSNAQAVAEHALMLMLACVKRTVEIDRLTRKGDWRARHVIGNTELAGKTLGIVGVGNIGRRVARFAGAIGMRVLGYDKYVPADEVRRRGAEPVGSLEELLPQVDVLTCHTPLTPETRHMIDEQTLALLRPGRSSSTRHAAASTASEPSSRPWSRSAWPPRASTCSNRSRARSTTRSSTSTTSCARATWPG